MRSSTSSRWNAFRRFSTVAALLIAGPSVAQAAGSGAGVASESTAVVPTPTKAPASVTPQVKPATSVAVTTKDAPTAKTAARQKNAKLPVMWIPPAQRVAVTRVKPATVTPTVTTAARPTTAAPRAKAAQPKDYGVTVAASRPVSPTATAKVVSRAPTKASPVMKVAVPAGTRVTAVATPAPVSPTKPAAVNPTKQALATAQANDAGWSFRKVQAGGSSSTKVVATTLAAGALPVAVKPAIPATKPAATTTVAAKPATPATKPAATTTVAAKPAAPATKPAASTTVGVKPAAPAAKPAVKTMKGVMASSSTAPAKPAAVAVTKPAAVKVAAGPAVPAKATPAAASAGAKAKRKGAPLVPAVQTLGAAFMEQREMYVYSSLDRRDPFASLVSGAFEGTAGTPLLDVSSMDLVGIVWGSSDRFALVEDGRGHGFVLRVGDPVLNGYVAGLTKEELIVKQSSYGDTQTVTIQLQRKEGASHAN